MKMVEIWIKTLLTTLDDELDEEKKQAIIETCGANCPFTHLPDEKLLALKEQADSEEAFLELLARHWRLEKRAGNYYLVFDRCYCPLVENNPTGASQTLCYCTLGNIKHKLMLGLGKEVEVVMEKTVLGGDHECRFLLKL